MKRRFVNGLIAVVFGVTLSTLAVQTVSADSDNQIWRSSTKSNTKFPSSPKPAQPANNNYVALGDSVAAGLGLAAPAGATESDTQCGRSSQAYAATVASRLKLSLTNVACSGATAGDLVTKQAVSGPNITAQLDTAFANGTPKLITITAGANDVHWDEFIRLCYATNCATKTNTTIANAYLSVLQVKLAYALASIQARSGANTLPRVILTGYYNPVSSKCVDAQQNITAGEITWISNRTSQLNQTIKQSVASYPFARFAAVSFADHDICSAQPWVQGLSDVAPLHPNAQGQKAISKAIVTAYNQK